MKITGSTQIDLSLENFDYEIKLNTNQGNIIDLGIKKHNEKNNNSNIINFESKLGNIKINLDLLTEENKIPQSIEDFDFVIKADYNLTKNLNMGLKYETDGNQSSYEILSGTILSKAGNDNIKLNLYSENILWGYKMEDFNKISLFGNKIKPSISLLEENIDLGLVYYQKEEIDDYGNNNKSSDVKLSLDLNLNL